MATAAQIELELKKKLSDETLRAFSIHKNVKGKNPALWDKFGIVHDNSKKTDCEFTACFACKQVYTFKAKTGTSTIAAHKCPHDNQQVGAMHVFAMQSTANQSDKKKMTQSAANYCALDMRPFESLACQGLKDLLQTALDIGVASKGRLMIDDLLAAPITIRRNVEERAEVGRQKLEVILKKHMDSGVFVSCTLDLWTDSVKKVSYMSITIHYIDAEFVLHDRTLHVKPVREASHTAEMVLDEFKEGLAVFNLFEDVFQNIIVVSDSGSNCCAANGIPSEFAWQACLDHRLATTLTTVINKHVKQKDGQKLKAKYKYINTPHMNELYEMIDDCKELVAYFKKSNLQCKLSNTLKQENATRWNSLLRSLLSILEMLTEIIALLRGKGQLAKLARIQEALLKEFTTFLAMFQQATLALEQFKTPTLHKVAYWRNMLLNHLAPVDENILDEDGEVVKSKDSAPIIAIKKIIKPIFEEMFKLKPIHVVAVLLDPVMKNRLRGTLRVDTDHIDEGKLLLKEYMHKIGDGKEEAEVSDVPAPPPAKKQRLDGLQSMYDGADDDEYEDLVEQARTPTDSLAIRIDTEFRVYLEYKLSDQEQKDVVEAVRNSLPTKDKKNADFRVLTWWKIKGAAMFPIMARVARSILCVPAASAKSECNFSDTGNTITLKRNGIKPSVVNDLMFLRSNKDISKM
jgi:hypothetical protein